MYEIMSMKPCCRNVTRFHFVMDLGDFGVNIPGDICYVYIEVQGFVFLN